MRTWVAFTLAAATVAVAPAAGAADEVVARWQMDEKAGASVMQDSAAAGGDNDGAIHHVTTGVAGLASGNAYTFDGATSYVEVPDADGLDPGTAAISLTATVRAVDGRMPDDSYDLVRKGVVKTKGGYWKMEIKRASNASVGRLHCVFRGRMPDGSMQIAKKIAKPDVVDGRVHTLQCVRDGNKIKAVVDGRAYNKTKATGSIANSLPVIVGAKRAGDDVLLGTLDEVVVRVG